MRLHLPSGTTQTTFLWLDGTLTYLSYLGYQGSNIARGGQGGKVLGSWSSWGTDDSVTPFLVFVPDSAILPKGLSIHCREQQLDKCKGGGVCIMVNKHRCVYVQTISTGCSPDPEQPMIKCRPFHRCLRPPTCQHHTGAHMPTPHGRWMNWTESSTSMKQWWV